MTVRQNLSHDGVVSQLGPPSLVLRRGANRLPGYPAMSYLISVNDEWRHHGLPDGNFAAVGRSLPDQRLTRIDRFIPRLMGRPRAEASYPHRKTVVVILKVETA